MIGAWIPHFRILTVEPAENLFHKLKIQPFKQSSSNQHRIIPKRSNLSFNCLLNYYQRIIYLFSRHEYHTV